ncbi:hypothetical protein ACO0SA_001472 [Hanseniaspora valbyensis]
MAIDPITHISFDKYIIIQLPNELYKIYNTSTEVIGLGKYGSFYSKDIVGYPYGTVFDIEYEENDTEDQNKKQKGKKEENPGVAIPRKDNTAQSLEITDDILSNNFNSESNRLLIDQGSSIQKLSNEDIELLKEQNTRADKLISNIISNNGNFQLKTKQSQQKYLIRKFRKFSKCFKVERCTPQNLLKFLMDKNDLLRINDISLESIALQLNLSNIQPNGNYLVMDETGGFLIYSILERMYGGKEDDETKKGTITIITETEHPQLDLLKYSNYSDEFLKKTIKYISVMELLKPQTEEFVRAEFLRINEDLNIDELLALKERSPLQQRKVNWFERQMSLIKISNTVDYYDALVLQTDFELKELVDRISKYVKPGSPIVVFCKFREPLLDLSNEYLMKNLNFLNVKILQTSCRPYQTKRGKIHPLMTMKSNGGWLLSCIKVIYQDINSVDKE